MHEHTHDFTGPAPSPTIPGMTLRDWFAGQAIAGMCSKAEWLPENAASIAADAYAYADAMLKAREARRTARLEADAKSFTRAEAEAAADHIIRLVVDACARSCDDFDAPASDSEFVNGQATAAQQIHARILALAPKKPAP